jgi:uncharacterized protein (DUF1501 family)
MSSHHDFNPSRRSLIGGGAAAGLAVTFLGGCAYAASEGDLSKKKLVVLICRGAMDGLSVTAPVGDRNYMALRQDIAIPGFGQPGGALKLDGTFGLHPRLAKVHDLYLDGQVRFAPAVATPDRERSHFEAQDVLENGSTAAFGVSSGWLNRALQAMAPARKVSAMAIGEETPLILQGKVQCSAWAPGSRAEVDPRLPEILTDLYADDPLLGPALAAGLQTAVMADAAGGGLPMGGKLKTYAGKPEAAKAVGVSLGKLMSAEGGPQVAAMSLYGFDTHHGQGASEGALALRLTSLDATIDGLHEGLGPNWNNTVVMVVTEFGRTARMNGTRGTDHGTASTALLIGGGVRKGGLIGDWPTLDQARLFENRDTAPTLDMRGLFKGVLGDHLAVDRAQLDTLVFPSSGDVRATQGLV